MKCGRREERAEEAERIESQENEKREESREKGCGQKEGGRWGKRKKDRIT